MAYGRHTILSLFVFFRKEFPDIFSLIFTSDVCSHNGTKNVTCTESKTPQLRMEPREGLEGTVIPIVIFKKNHIITSIYDRNVSPSLNKTTMAEM